MENQQHAARTASLFYKEVGRYPLPSKEDEVRQFAEYKRLSDQEKVLRERGDVPAADSCKQQKAVLGQKIACGYIRFVIKEARRRTRVPELLHELISEGFVGLMICVDRFDLARGNRFLTYAAWWINVQMQEHLKRIDHVHIPNHTRKEIRRRKKEEEVMFAKGEITRSMVEEPTIGPIDPNVHAATDDTAVAAMDNERNMLRYMVDADLPVLNRLVMIYYFGLRDGSSKTFNEISQLLFELDGSNVTSDRIRQIKEQSLQVLKEHLEDCGVEATSDLL